MNIKQTTGTDPRSVHSERNIRLALLALIAGAICIGLAPILVRLSETGPVATAFYRVFLGLPLMLVWMSTINRSVPDRPLTPVSGKDRMLLLLPGLFFAGDLGFWHWSIELTTVANATLFANFAPIYVTLVAAFVFKERFNRSFIIALILALAGAVILMGSSASFSAQHIKGDIFGMITAVFYAAYLLTIGRLRARFSTVTIMYWSSLSASLVLLPISWFTGVLSLPETVWGWGILVTLAWVSHLGGQGLITWALAHLSTAFSSLSLLLQPVVSALLAWYLFGETLGPVQICGGLIVLTGIYLARQASNRP